MDSSQSGAAEYVCGRTLGQLIPRTGLAVAPDGCWMLYEQRNRYDSDIIVGENFRWPHDRPDAGAIGEEKLAEGGSSQ